MPRKARTDVDGFLEHDGHGSWWDGLRDRALTSMLAVLCLIVFVAAPLVATGSIGARVSLEVMLLATAILVVLISRTRLIAGIAASAALVVMAGSVCSFLVPSLALASSAQIGLLVGSIVTAYVVGSAVFAPGEVTAHRVFGAIVLYLNFGMIFTAAYRLA